MSCGQDRRTLMASLGTEFHQDRGRDRVRITAADGSELEVPGPDLREFLDHLTEGVDTEPPDRYGDVLERVRDGLVEIEARILRERATAESEFQELVRLPVGERCGAVETDPRFHTLGLANLILAAAREAVHHHLGRSLELAELARHVAHRLSPQVYGARQLRDLQSYAEAIYGNALRVNSELDAAREAFLLARELLDLGSGDPHTVLEIDRLEISLRRQLRDFSGALELTDRVVAGNLELGEVESAAQALQKKAMVLNMMEETERALEALQDAAHLTRGSKDPLLLFTVHHSLAHSLVRLGRPAEAEEWVPPMEAAARRLASRRVDATCLWLRGLIALEREDPAGATKALVRAREIFEADGFLLDFANVSLDLAAALGALGETSRVVQLAAATYAFMEAQGAQTDALAALAILRQAAAREEINRDLLRSLERRLERAFSQPPAPAS